MATDYIKPKSTIMSRYADDTGVYQGACNANLANWPVGDEFIVVLLAECNAKAGATEEIRIEWENQTDQPGTWNQLQAAAGELRQGTATDLVNCTSPSVNMADGLCGCDTPLEDSHEIEGAISATMVTTDKTIVDMYFAIDPSNADPGDVYAFRLYSVTGAAVIGDGTAWTGTVTFLGLTDASEDLFCKFTVRRTGTEDLFADFTPIRSASEDLFADFTVRQEATEDLFSKFEVRQIGTEDLFSKFILRKTGTEDLFADFKIGQPGSEDLFADFTVRQEATEDLFSKFTVRQTATTDLYADFTLSKSDSEDLYAKFEIRQTGAEDLFAKFQLPESETINLFAKFIIRQTGTEDLFSGIRWILGDWEIEMSADGSDAIRLSGPQRKIFKNPRGQGNWYCLVKYDTDEWKIQTSSDGRLWRWTGITIPSRDSPSLWTWEDVGNSRLVIWIAKKWGPSGDRDQDIRVDCYQIPDASILPTSLFTESVVQTKSVDLHYPCICRANDGYLWVVYTYGWDDGNYHGDIRAKCSTTTNPVVAPAWSTELIVEGQALADNPPTISRALVIPLYAFADVAVISAIDDEGVTNVISGRTCNYAGAGAPTKSAPCSIDISVHVDKDLSAVAAGPDSDVVIVYRDFGGQAFVARKYDISANTDTAFDRIDDTADVDEGTAGVVRHGNTDADQIVVILTTDNTNKEIHAYSRRFNGQAAWSPRKELHQFQTTTFQLPVNMTYEDVNGQLGIASAQQGALTRVWFWYFNLSSEELYAKFEVQKTGTEDLFADFVVRHEASQDLFADFEIQDSEDLFAKFQLLEVGTEGLFAKFNVRQVGIEDLFAKFLVGAEDDVELFAKFEVRQEAAQDLFADFTVRQETSQDLFAKFLLVSSASEDLFAKFEARQEAFEELFADFIVRQIGTADLFSKFSVRQEATQDLFAKLLLGVEDSVDLFAEFEVRQETYQELFGKATIRVSAYQELFADFTTIRSAAEELFSEFTVRQEASEDLFIEFEVRQSETQDLFAQFNVKRWHVPDSLTINIGSIQSGTIADTRVDDGNYLVLNELTQPGPSFDYDFVFENIPAGIHSLTIRFNGYYNGNPAHEVKARIYNYNAPGWEDLTVNANDFPSQGVEGDYFWTIYDTTDYISGGQLQVKAIHTSNGSAGHTFNVDFLWLDDESLGQGLFSELTVRHPGSEDLFAEFDIRSVGTQDLFAKLQIALFEGFEDLKAIFEVAAPTLDLFATFIIRKETYIRRRIFCKFVVTRPAVGALKGIFWVGYPATKDLFAKFETSTVVAIPQELLAKFYIRPDELEGYTLIVSGRRRTRIRRVIIH